MKLFKEIFFASALTLAALFTTTEAFAQDFTVGDLMISKTWSRQSPMASDVAAGFMVVHNHGTVHDRLIKATAEISNNVQLHDMKMEGDVMKMVELAEGIAIPAGATVELKPGSLHVMFMDMAKQPEVGSVFKGTLTFEKAGTIAVGFEVKGMQ